LATNFHSTTFLQFSKLANIYFLIISLLQLFTPLSPTSRYTTAGPLLLVLMVNLIREMWEDSRRHRDDAQVNNRMADVVGERGAMAKKAWKDLRVGDIIKVSKGEPLPADVVQLSSSEDQGSSYIDTCDLDGETNLKIKSSLSTTVHATKPSEVAALRGSLEYEAPNKRLYTFLGKVVMNGQEVAVDNDVVLLRGAVLRNTPWIYALVVYAGKQTKVMMNSQAAKAKRSNVDRAANVILAAVLVFLALVCTAGCVGHVLWMEDPANMQVRSRVKIGWEK
jgi:phospholipid-transporting ATPase